MELIQYARKKIPEVSFTSDILVGFPGETYEDFKETLRLVQEIEYDSLYTFIYSKREGQRPHRWKIQCLMQRNPDGSERL